MMYPNHHESIYFIYLSVRLSICLSIFLSILIFGQNHKMVPDSSPSKFVNNSISRVAIDVN